MILVIDNYDSFVHNLARYFRQLGTETMTVRNDAIDVAAIRALAPAAIAISPGPCTPNEAGISLEVVRAFAESTPILGVCLGHQAIVQAMEGKIVPAQQPMHGQSSEITHSGSPLFKNVPDRFSAGRYHSLVAEPNSLPNQLNVTSTTGDGVVMSVEHESLPVVGVQFHPESTLTEHGHQILQNFLAIAGCSAETAGQNGFCTTLSNQETRQPLADTDSHSLATNRT